MADALLLQKLGYPDLGVLHAEPVQNAGVHHYAGLAVCKGGGLYIPALHHLDDGQTELLGKVPVPVVVGGHGHDSAGAVAYKDVVGDEDGYLSAVHRVDGCNTHELYARLLLGNLGALEVGLSGRLGLILTDLVHIAELIGPLLYIGVLWGDDHICGPIQGVGPGGVYPELIPGGGIEVHLRAGGSAYPVLLLEPDPLGIVHLVQVVYQPLGVLGDLQHPLRFDLVHHLAAAALANAVDHLLVGKHALAAGAPVDVHLLLIGKAVLIELQEYPLGPLVILRVDGGYLPAPVEGYAQGLYLPLIP